MMTRSPVRSCRAFAKCDCGISGTDWVDVDVSFWDRDALCAVDGRGERAFLVLTVSSCPVELCVKSENGLGSVKCGKLGKLGNLRLESMNESLIACDLELNISVT